MTHSSVRVLVDRRAHGVVAEHEDVGLLERPASAERGPSSNSPSSPKSEPSSSTATSDSRPSGERVRMATRPLTMPNSSDDGSPWRKSTSLRATVRDVDCWRSTSSVSGGSAPSSCVVSRMRRSVMVLASVVTLTQRVGEPGEGADRPSGILALRSISARSHGPSPRATAHAQPRGDS